MNYAILYSRHKKELREYYRMVITFSNAQWAAFRENAEAHHDAELARIFREKNAAEVAPYSDHALIEAIKAARLMAVELGITHPHLRLRFIMLGVFRLPRFWQDDRFMAMLRAPTGTPDGRFLNVCGVIKDIAHRANAPHNVWW